MNPPFDTFRADRPGGVAPRLAYSAGIASGQDPTVLARRRLLRCRFPLLAVIVAAVLRCRRWLVPLCGGAGSVAVVRWFRSLHHFSHAGRQQPLARIFLVWPGNIFRNYVYEPSQSRVDHKLTFNTQIELSRDDAHFGVKLILEYVIPRFSRRIL